MAVEIRHPRVDEFETLMRYVERAFGHSKAFFQRAYPHLYQPTEEAMRWAYVIEEGGGPVSTGEIVSHVGVYPIEAVTAGVHFSIGGIGAVSTSPAARGKGYMTQLMTHIVAEMRRIGYPVSWLGGDRQRYNSFGWEMASLIYDLSFTNRSLKWHGVAPVEIEEVFPEGALATIERCQAQQACHTIRPDLARQVQAMDLRFWIAEDGYAILHGQERRQLRVMELVSTSGNEIGMIRALLDWNFGERASWALSMWDKARLGRLMRYASYWGGGNSAMYRVNDLTQVLMGARGYLDQQAQGLRDFAVALGVNEGDRISVTTLTVEGGSVDIRAGRHASTYVELPVVEATRLVLGGPPVVGLGELPIALTALLPVPCYVMPLDHV
jgi:predicted N-acetyltransferase YhbS